MNAQSLIEELKEVGNPEAAIGQQRFFKTYDGGYGEGDQFLGLKVPVIRAIAAPYVGLTSSEIDKLLDNPLHEVRFAGVVIMAKQAASKKATDEQKKALYEQYLRRSDAINNWDIVDVSCRDVVGEYLVDKPRDELYKLAASPIIWQRRAAIVCTFAFLSRGQSADTYRLAELLLQDTHDLMHKAVGWMLREAGKRVSRDELLAFLDKHAANMPRTALRYAIEHLPAEQRQHYMQLGKPPKSVV